MRKLAEGGGGDLRRGDYSGETVGGSNKKELNQPSIDLTHLLRILGSQSRTPDGGRGRASRVQGKQASRSRREEEKISFLVKLGSISKKDYKKK